MVSNVAREKTTVTNSTPAMLASAAGYISNGISGSQGPNRKIVNKIHGVILAGFAAGGCKWSVKWCSG